MVCSMTPKNSLEIVYLSAAAIKPSPHAARRHSTARRRKLKVILQQFGQVVPLPLDAATGTLIDSHAVLDALVELGHHEIAVVRLASRSGSEVRALRLALDRIAEDAVWDDAKLRGKFELLISGGFDLDLSDFEAVEIDMALSIDTQAAITVEEAMLDEIAPVAGGGCLPAWRRVPSRRPRDRLWRRARCKLHPQPRGRQDRRRSVQRCALQRADRRFVSGLGKTRHREFAMGSGEISRDQQPCGRAAIDEHEITAWSHRFRRDRKQ